ncbi:MAG: prepilin-type N-terminal cleavage/methylation domain-containing protein [Acidobacteria bacterium]|nr:prepilin-type N-terminal cleavage/methylation domain-containing protein [Acidobacteriota bacterium]
MTRRARPGADAGFTLIEVLVAMVLTSIGVLALMAATTLMARKITGSQEQFIASQRASEAIESVFKARDNRVLTWAQIRNRVGESGADGGIFFDGPRDVRDPGADGLVNTTDDGDLATVVKPGPDALLGTADDITTPLFGFTREIEIRNLGPSLRRVRVIVRYRTAAGPGQYVLTTFLSSYA